MGCGCGGAQWTPPTEQQIAAGQTAATQKAAPKPVERTRELIPGGYWNGPQAKK